MKVNEIYESPRLILRLARADMACPLLEYYQKNKEFLRPYDPQRDETFYSLKVMRSLLESERLLAEKDVSYRFYVSPKERPEIIIGLAGINNIVYGAFRSCFLSYKLDQAWLHRGFMMEAVSELIQTVAFDTLALHRVEANIMQRNTPSIRVAQNCGLEFEGVSKNYLLINGHWEDHAHYVRLNRALE